MCVYAAIPAFLFMKEIEITRKMAYDLMTGRTGIKINDDPYKPMTLVVTMGEERLTYYERLSSTTIYINPANVYTLVTKGLYWNYDYQISVEI